MKSRKLELAGFIVGLSGGLGILSAMAGEQVLVSIDKYTFDPPVITVKAGTTVVWANQEKRTSHDVTVPSLGKASERLMPGDGFSVLFDKPGTYDYVCETHKDRPEMHGKVIVTE